MNKKKWIKRISTGTAVLLLSGSLYYGGKTYISYKDMISNSVREGISIADKSSKEDFIALEPTRIYDADKKMMKELKERNYKYEDITSDASYLKKVSDVVTSIEDERFYKHKGFDYWGVLSAAVGYMKSGQLRGASTLTQQLVKNTYLTQDRKLDRKIKEAVIAQEIDEKFSKEEILEFYVNQNYYGNGQYGLGIAAQYYYNKPASELTTGELAVLIGIPNNPTIYDPISNPENAKTKRDTILFKMKELERISEKEYLSEIKKDLNLKVTPHQVDNNIQGDDLRYAIHSAIEKMMEDEGFYFSYGKKSEEEQEQYDSEYSVLYSRIREKLLKGGYEIYTSIQPQAQKNLESAVESNMSQYTERDENGIHSKQASATIIDNATGEVIAIVGGRQNENDQFSRAYQGRRQPGSVIKPFLSYTPAFETGYSTESVKIDAAIPGGPLNWYRGYWGAVTLRKALEQSINTIAFNLVSELGTENVMQKLVDMRFKFLDSQDFESPIVGVGGFTHGTNTTEMASAMGTLVNQGVYRTPSNVREISTTGKKETLYNRENESGVKVYEAGSSYMMIDVMKGVTKPGAMGSDASFGYKHVAGKTGTTDNASDYWFIGASPHYSMAIWEGNERLSPQGEYERLIPMNIFRDAMKPLHEGKKEKDFTRPSSVLNIGGKELVSQTINKEDLRLKRQNEENERIREENKFLTSRLESLIYRIKYGLSLNETKNRERKVQTKIDWLYSYEVSDSDISEAEEVYHEAKSDLEEVVREKEKDSLSEELEYAYDRILEESQMIKDQEEAELNWIREQAQEEERQEQERIKQEKEDQEQEIQESIEREAEEESSKIELEQESVETSESSTSNQQESSSESGSFGDNSSVELGSHQD